MNFRTELLDNRDKNIEKSSMATDLHKQAQNGHVHNLRDPLQSPILQLCSGLVLHLTVTEP